MSPGQTHWEGCYQAYGHYECAQEEITRLRAEIKEEKRQTKIVLDSYADENQRLSDERDAAVESFDDALKRWQQAREERDAAIERLNSSIALIREAELLLFRCIEEGDLFNELLTKCENLITKLGEHEL